MSLAQTTFVGFALRARRLLLTYELLRVNPRLISCYDAEVLHRSWYQFLLWLTRKINSKKRNRFFSLLLYQNETKSVALISKFLLTLNSRAPLFYRLTLMTAFRLIFNNDKIIKFSVSVKFVVTMRHWFRNTDFLFLTFFSINRHESFVDRLTNICGITSQKQWFSHSWPY